MIPDEELPRLLDLLGETDSVELKLTVPEAGRRAAVTALGMDPLDAQIVELSTKCPPADAFPVAAEARAFLTGKGVDIGGEQETKTRKALQFFSRRLQAAAR